MGPLDPEIKGTPGTSNKQGKHGISVPERPDAQGPAAAGLLEFESATFGRQVEVNGTDIRHIQLQQLIPGDLSLFFDGKPDPVDPSTA